MIALQGPSPSPPQSSKVFGFVLILCGRQHEEHPAANANHPGSFIAPGLHWKKEGSSTLIKKTFPEMPPFGFGSVASSCPQVGKRKNLSRYHKAGSRLRSLIKVQLTRRREDAQKLKAL
jgi:hypothetical protein